jgi:hypothetical protein
MQADRNLYWQYIIIKIWFELIHKSDAVYVLLWLDNVDA